MGKLSEQYVDDDNTALPVTGLGRLLVEWWTDVADDDDRALMRQWVDGGPKGGGKSHREIAERLVASGFDISIHTVSYGVRLLRRLPEWES